MCKKRPTPASVMCAKDTVSLFSYSGCILQRDTEIRYDFALKIANALDIPVASICEDIPDAKEMTVIDPSIPGTINIDVHKASHFSTRTMELARYFNNEEVPVLDKLISEFYVLDDEARDEILKIIEIKHATHDDPDRIKKLDVLKKKKSEK